MIMIEHRGGSGRPSEPVWAYRWVLMSALIVLQEGAKKRGADVKQRGH